MNSEREILFGEGACKPTVEIVDVCKEESMSKYLGANSGQGSAVFLI